MKKYQLGALAVSDKGLQDTKEKRGRRKTNSPQFKKEGYSI